MTERTRVDRVDLGVFGSQKVIDVYAKEFTCTAAGKITGDLDAELAEIRGSCKVEGNVKTLLLKVGGAMKVNGDIKAELIRSKGALKVLGSVNADHFRIAGATKIEKAITSSHEISVMGVLKCGSDVSAGKFTLLGVADIDGTLKASEFNANLSGRSTIRNLNADKIDVRIKKKKRDTELISKKIIGKDIYLEATIAEYVEGDNVELGPGCLISEVKAKSLEVHKKSKVGKILPVS